MGRVNSHSRQLSIIVALQLVFTILQATLPPPRSHCYPSSRPTCARWISVISLATGLGRPSDRTRYPATSLLRVGKPAASPPVADMRSTGVTRASTIQLAAVVEFIHTATFLHDDVVTILIMRRGNATANETLAIRQAFWWGTSSTPEHFQMMVDAQNMRIMQVLADATNVIAEGEVLQLMNMHNAALDEAGYLAGDSLQNCQTL
jgi:geranylgeranyl pyrophosphate synthase